MVITTHTDWAGVLPALSHVFFRAGRLPAQSDLLRITRSKETRTRLWTWFLYFPECKFFPFPLHGSVLLAQWLWRAHINLQHVTTLGQMMRPNNSGYWWVKATWSIGQQRWAALRCGHGIEVHVHLRAGHVHLSPLEDYGATTGSVFIPPNLERNKGYMMNCAIMSWSCQKCWQNL